MTASLRIGALLFDGIDQADVTGPFEVLARLPGASYTLYGLTAEPVRDVCGLRLLPDAAIEDAPPLDIVHIPGGFGQEALMADDRVLDWIRRQSAGAQFVLSVCTGALLLGAAGLLRGRRATTHWSALPLLAYFGAEPVDERVVIDGSWIFAAGVTAGFDAALRLAALVGGEEVAQEIQLQIAYAPQPPFAAGTPRQAPAAVLARARAGTADVTRRRERTAAAIGARLGVPPPAMPLAAASAAGASLGSVPWAPSR